jgi:hypothetical protein
MKSLKNSLFVAVTALFAGALVEGRAEAFPHTMQPGETLAQLAIVYYGSARFEPLLIGANGLDAHGSATIPGMRVEVPAPGHHRVTEGETWLDLAERFLGDRRRAEYLAKVNNAVAWVPPSLAQEVQVPAVLVHLGGDDEKMSVLAARYLGNANRYWELNAYNFRKNDGSKKSDEVTHGEVVLVPLFELVLTEEGKREARKAGGRVLSEGGGEAHEAQKRGETEIPPLLADVRYGRYVDAVARGNRLLGSGDLTRAQLATIHRALLESYVALDAWGAAVGACTAWRTALETPDTRDTRDAKKGPRWELDPRTVSPKIRAACTAK